MCREDLSVACAGCSHAARPLVLPLVLRAQPPNELSPVSAFFGQVEFPERAGALARFLSVVSPAFNVTLFHYRRTGADPHPSMRARACVHAASLGNLSSVHASVVCVVSSSGCQHVHGRRGRPVLLQSQQKARGCSCLGFSVTWGSFMESLGVLMC